MQVALTLCYILISISVTPSCGHPATQLQELSNGRKQIERRMGKREASIIIDNFPMETMEKPKVVYRRLSKHIYRAPKPKYGPSRPKYGSSKATRKPLYNNYKYKKMNAKFPPPKKNRSTKPRYTSPRNPFSKKKPNNRYARPKPEKKQPIIKHHPNIQEPAGFGEPPANYQPSGAGYGEPPVDSYGAPLDTKFQEPYEGPGEFANNLENPEKNLGQDYLLPDLTQPDNNYGYSHKYQTFMKPNLNVFNYEYDSAEHNLNSYSDVYAGTKTHNDHFLKKKPNLNGDAYKLINRPWKAARPKQKQKVLVGGQYAEPPARYVAKLQPSGPIDNVDEENFNPLDGFVDLDSARTVSPYVNYKNSNMAFSPQNLNDAFSIVDKKR